ncbi:glutamate synthase (NADPH) GltB3 subunit [Geoalkalibacter ferrihydriticus]|uniref:dihydrouracil dehydrogenase (NAD(+)) n=2 Tax=Geoalkalibacter ferrihydriticus TaxID=392333 RepID=A0A0C2DRH9_9BACT|nr:FAD-dependent oxidoreductase [Geoalkalibacter ferrihydriticus]KIH76049.1 4Fe-4S ferredoxin [Geoalkalibacter ferrihydriticus DSM 17813]SDM48061.1 glutamate synthase (NADPH) GltB3 subunit [Geoalkalibacter ferrihydriticus]
MPAQISAFNENKQRVSTQQLLQQIYAALETGETEFEVLASGHHNIGGPLWTQNGQPLRFRVKNPGQRVGSFGLDGTEILVEGSTPADAGWLNSGATLTILGDGGDTTAHCAAAGRIYVAGRVGARSGSLMKHDPAYENPEFWVLKSTGSFSFEFMGGGIAVVCGIDCEGFDSVLGDRSCVGMVGGTIYVRGPVSGLSDEVWLLDLDDADREFLAEGLPRYLGKINRPELRPALEDFSQWKKILSKTYEERTRVQHLTMREFRLQRWVEGGIFGDVVSDDYTHVAGLVNSGADRLKIPHWQDKRYAAPCESSCPTAIPTQERIKLLRQGKVQEALELVLRYSPFPGSVCGEVCPNLCMDACTRQYIDKPVAMKELGRLSRDAASPQPAPASGKKVAVIGGGPGGLSTAWQLRLRGHEVTVYEADNEVGGKLRQAIPTERLPAEVLRNEITRIKELGVSLRTNTPVDQPLFDSLRTEHDAVVIASGAHSPVVIPFPGHERLVKGIDFLKAINAGERPTVGERVVVLGAGNAGMDTCLGAYAMGAKKVTSVDIQRPAAYQKEIDHVKALGGEIIWPFFTDRVDEKGVHGKDGTLLEADTVIIAIGERPDLSYVPRDWLSIKGMMEVDDCWQVTRAPGVFAIGDTIRPGLLTHAIGHGLEAAEYIDAYLRGETPTAKPKPAIVPQECLSKELFRPQNRGRLCVTDARSETNRCLSCGTCRDCSMCLEACPEGAISRAEKNNGQYEYLSDDHVCIGCGICAGICPCGVWSMEQAV